MDPLKTISKAQKIRLEKLGATVSANTVTATEDQLWKAPIVGGQRHLLDKRGNLVVDTGGGGYVANAVHFDGTAWLTRGAQLIGADQTKFISSFWAANIVAGTGNAILASFPNNTFDWYASTPTAISFAFGSSRLPQSDPPIIDLSTPVWSQVLLCVDTTLPTLAERVQIYLTGVQVTDLSQVSGFDAPAAMSGESEFYVGNDGYDDQLKGDVAQPYLAFGQWLDFSDPANLAKFIVAGKPVDLLTSGAPTPQLLMDGDHTTFATNQGNGGAFTLTGALTNATTSPSD